MIVIPYSGYNLRDAISANHQISHLEVIFAIMKFANHGMVLRARSVYVPSAYRYFDYKHRSEVDSFTIESVIRIPHLRGRVVKCNRRSVVSRGQTFFSAGRYTASDNAQR